MVGVMMMMMMMMHLLLNSFNSGYSGCIRRPVSCSHCPIYPLVNLGYIVRFLCCFSCFLDTIEYFRMVNGNR